MCKILNAYTNDYCNIYINELVVSICELWVISLTSQICVNLWTDFHKKSIKIPRTEYAEIYCPHAPGLDNQYGRSSVNRRKSSTMTSSFSSSPECVGAFTVECVPVTLTILSISCAYVHFHQSSSNAATNICSSTELRNTTKSSLELLSFGSNRTFVRRCRFPEERS